MDGTCVIKIEFLIIDEIRLLLIMNILVKFPPDIPILMVMGGGWRLTRYGPKIGVPVRSS
jgi:hypothetical protein